MKHRPRELLRRKGSPPSDVEVVVQQNGQAIQPSEKLVDFTGRG
jgi:hypothetical protein